MKNRILRVLQILFWLLFLAGIVWNALYLHHVLDDGKYYAHLTFLIMLLLTGIPIALHQFSNHNKE